MKKYDESEGIWRTIGGRKVFIRKGQNLADAMIESGKFSKKGKMRENYRKEKEKDKQEEKDLLNEINKDDTTENRNNYIDKNIDNRKKYEEEYERIDKEEKYDIEHGKTYPYREQYRKDKEMNETNEKIARHLENVSRVAEEMGDKKLAEINRNASNYAKSQRKDVDDYLNRDKSKDKLNYNENTKEDTLHSGTFRKKEDKSTNERFGYNDARDILNQLNSEGSDFTFGEIETDKYNQDYKEAGKLKAEVSVFMPDERGYTTRELEIPIDKNETRESFEEKLRDWQSRHSSPDTWEDEDFKSTNDDDELARISGGVISTLKTSVPQSKQERLKPGTEIYYKGDQANTPGYFTIESFDPEKEQFMASITLKEKGGEGRTKKIGAQQIEDSYTNNYASRFAFKEDYDKFRNQAYENLKKYTDNLKSNQSNNEIMNNAIREKASKKKEIKQDLPKHTEIKSQGTSNRKEVSENIQAHILDHYDSPEDFIEQMDAYDWKPTNWHRGEALAEDGFYEIYYDDQRKFLDDLKINPKGKDFDDDRVFQTYKSLIGRESAKLYDRIKRNQFNQYKKDHPLTKMTFEDFKDMKK